MICTQREQPAGLMFWLVDPRPAPVSPEASEAWRLAMTRLPERLRLIIVMHFRDDLPFEHIAYLLDLRLRIVQQLMDGALGMLREIVDVPTISGAAA